MLTSWLRKLAPRPRTVRKSRPSSRTRLTLHHLEARETPAGLYDVQWLGTLNATDNFSVAQGINDLGQVVGNSYVQDTNGIPVSENVFRYDPSTGMVNLGTAGATGALVWDINNSGTVTGWVHEGGTLATGGYWEWAAIWDSSGGHTIPGYGQPGMSSVAYGINDNGVVVGHSDVVGQIPNGEAYKYDGSTLTFLGTLGGKWSYGMDINNTNYVAGFADTGENPSKDPNVYMSRYHAVIWGPDGTIRDLGTLGTDSYAYKINATGQAVGSSIASDGYYHAFLWNGTRMIDIGAANSNSEALSINNAGQVVGDTVNWLNSSAFLYENGTMYDLNTLVNALGTDSILSAHDINNLGQIVGYGLHNGHYEACILNPTGLVPPSNPPTNGAPTADAGGPYTIVAGNGVTLDGTKSSDPDGDTLAYSWDVNGDGVFGDATTANPSLTWADLQALGIAGGNTYSLSVQVDDGHGHTATASTTLTVDNTTTTPSGPTATVSGPTDGFQGVTGQERTLLLGADGALAANGFEFTVQWGDGTYDTLNGASGITATHVYDAVGTYTVSVTATDSDGVASDPAQLTLDIRGAEMQGNVLAVGGTSADDTITLAAGSTYGTVDTAYGTFTAGQVLVYGDKGSDRVVVQGTAGNDTLGINPDAVALNGFFVQGTSIENWTADGLAGDDTFYLNGPGLPITVRGGDGNDHFYLTSVGAVNGQVDGGAGSDILDYAQFHAQATVNLQDQTATGTNGFANVEGFVGSNSFDTLIAANTANTWTMNGYNSGTINSVQFGSFENWVGGSAVDTFKLVNTRYISGSIDGGAGMNALDYSLNTSAVAVDLAAGTATAVRGGVVNIANVYGGSGADTLTGDAGDNILLGNAGNDVLNGGPGGNDVLIGGAGADSLTGSAGRNILVGGLGADTLLGGTGEDILIGGTTNFDANTSALDALRAEWARLDLTYQQRIDHLTGKSAGGLNGSIKLASKTVKDDRTADSLSGGDGMDWFWGLTGEVKDRISGERLN